MGQILSFLGTVFENGVHLLYHPAFAYALAVLAISLMIASAQLSERVESDKLSKKREILHIKQISGMFSGLAIVMWFYIYKGFKGFDVVLDDENLTVMKRYKQTLWFFEILTFIIPIGLIMYKWYYTNETILGYIGKDDNKARTLLLEQMSREDTVVAMIPIALFGIGTVFDKQKFTHNRYLLGGVFFGSIVPVLMEGLIIDTQDVIRLLYIENMKSSFVLIGVTMIMLALFKYYSHKKALKEEAKLGRKKKARAPNYAEFGKNLSDMIKSHVSENILYELKKCKTNETRGLL